MKVPIVIESKEGQLREEIVCDREPITWSKDDIWMVAGKMLWFVTEPSYSNLKCRAWAERVPSDSMRVVVETDKGDRLYTGALPRSQHFPEGDVWTIRTE